MSPAAVDFRSPFTSASQMQSKQQQSFTPQNPNPSSGLSFYLGAFSSNNLPEQCQGSLRSGSETNDGSNVGNASPFVSQMSSEKFNCSSVSRRSKRRLVKVRRQLGSQQGKSASVPAQNDSGLNPSQYVSGNCIEVENTTSSASNGFGASIGDVKSEKLDNVDFAFGANESSFMLNLNLVKEKYSGTLGQASADGFGRTNNVGLVFGVNKSNSDLNSNSEHNVSREDVGQLGPNEFRKFENVGFVFGANKSSSIKYPISEKGQSSGSMQQSGADEFEQFNDEGFVFGANKSNSLSNKNSEQRASTENVGQLHANEFRKFENGGYVFGANRSNFILNLNLEKGQHGESAEKSEAGEFQNAQFGSKPATSASSSIFETREPSINVGMFDEGRGIKEENKAEFRKLDDNGHVFGTKHGDLKSNSNVEKKESGENVEKSAYGARGKMKLDVGKVDNVDFVFGGNWSVPRSNLDSVKSESGENGGQSVPFESQNMKSGAQLGMFDNMGFVFGDYPKGSSSVSDFQRRKSSESAGILVFEDDGKMKVELQKANANDVFMFGSSSKKNSSFSESTKLTDDMNKVNSENSGNCTSFVSTNTDKLGSDVNNKYNFVFGSSVNTTSASGTSTVRKLSHEMRKLTVDDCEKIGCSGNNKDPNIKSCASSNDVFVFGSNKKSHGSCTGKSGTTSCDQIKNSNLEGAGNDSAVEKTEGINARSIGENIFVFASSNDAACSLGGGAQDVMPNEKNTNTRSGLGVLDEQIRLGCPFGRFWEENQPTNVNEKSSDDPSVGISTPKPFTFQAGLGKSSDGPRDQLNDDPKLNKTSNQSVFLSSGLFFEAPPIGRVEKKDEFSFISTPVGVGSTTMDFRTLNGDASCSFTMNLYPGLNRKLEFIEKSRSIRDKRWYKVRGKLRQAIRIQQQSRQNIVSKESSQQNLESPGCYSPMDYSPYQDNNCVASTVNATTSTHAKDEDLAAASGANTSDAGNCREPNEEVSKNHDERCIADSSLEKGETECSNSKSEQISINSGNGGGVAGDGVNSNMKREESECTKKFCFASSAEDIGGRNFTFSAASAQDNFSATNRQNRKKYRMKVGSGDGVNSNMKREESECKKKFCFASIAEDIGGRNFTFSAASAQDNFSATNRQNRKKYRMKVGSGPNCTPPSRKVDTGSSSVQFSSLDGSYLHLNQAQDKEGDNLNSQRKGENKSKGDEEHDKPGFTAASQEACEKCRIRGNQAYEKGHLSKAEEFYTKGINSVPHTETSGCCIEPLVLCYSNRAAARMSRGRMREALGDCMMAAALDANFHKVQIRAANCHLALGEVEDALQYFTKCLESGSDVCLDRRTIIEAANGLQKAQKVADCMNQCAELLQQRTSNAAASAFEIISVVLSISSYSEKLLEMKGEALLMLRRYEEVIQLCEQTLVFAEKNFSMVAGDNNLGNADDPKYNSSIRLWRWRLMSKAHFHLGRLEVALDLLEKQELLKSAEDRYGSNTQESLIPFAVTVRELLHRKNAGNEAYQSGRHTKAVEHYTAAVSSSIESRPFAAICFCNRAAAYQALGQIADAIADCSLAIALDGSYSKAVSRRATLQETIRDYEQAASDLQRLISLLEKQSQEKVQQSGTPDRPTGSNGKELRQAHRRLSSVEENAKKGISLDHYLILGVKPSDTAPEIKKAYRKAALRHHPDKAGQFLARSESGDDGQLWKEIADEVHKDADRLFKMIGEAYAVLSDPTKRSQYDLQEELRNAQKESNGSRTSRRSSNFYSSPYESSANRRYWRSPRRYMGTRVHNGRKL